MLPDPPAQPLVGKADIIIQSGFAPTAIPRDFELRDNIRLSPELAVWRTWTPQDQSVPGFAYTHGFRLPRHLVVPYTGFAGEPGISLYVECIASRARLTVATARTNTQWAESVVSVPVHWCDGPARVVASSDSHEKYIGFGTPFAISTLSWLKTRWFGLLGVWALAFTIAAGFAVACAVALRARRPSGDPLAPGFIGFGCVGFFAFFVFQWSTEAGAALTAAVCVVAAAGAWAAWRAPRAGAGWSGAAQVVAAWKGPLAAWMLVSLGDLGLLHALDSGAGPWLANARFAPVRWSTDNQLAMLVGEHLSRLRLADLDLRPWLVSDRTPLAYGWHALLRKTTLSLASGDDGYYAAPLFHGVFGILLNASWAAVCTHALSLLGWRRRAIVAAIAVAAFVPFCIFNTIYAWPKMLGGSFGLLAACVLLLPGAEGNSTGRRWVYAAFLSALAMLTHGGTLFGVLAMLACAPFVAPRPSLRALAAAALAGACLLLPWSLWQHFVQPPGNALMKNVFAGTYGWEDPGRGVLATIADSYRSIDAATWLGMKADGLRELVLPATPVTCTYGEMVPGTSGLARSRIDDFTSVALSLRFLWIGLPAFLVAWAARRRHPMVHQAGILFATGLLGITASLLLSWDCQVIATQAYQSILALMLGCLVSLQCLAPAALRWIAWAGCVAYGMAAWIVGPLLGGGTLDPAALGSLFGVAALAIWLALQDRNGDTARLQEQAGPVGEP